LTNTPSTQEFKKAIDALKIATQLLDESIKNTPDNIELHKALRDSCIQRFEFCVELGWKVSMKILGLNTQAPNTAIREMAQNNLIDNTQTWFDLLIARNKTSHTYNEDIAREVYKITIQAIQTFEYLFEKLKAYQNNVRPI
jgi:nucleotidyltransferase substrate binding protein (TIGR01987 family)